MKERNVQGKGPWLHALANQDLVLAEVLEFMACRCFVHNNQQSTVRGYLAANNCFRSMYEGWELSTSPCKVVAVAKGIDRAHGMTTKRKPCRLPLTWSMSSQGKREFTAMANGGLVMWLGLALLCFLLCRASELWAYANGQVNPDFCLTRSSLTFFRGGAQLAFEHRSSTDAVQVRFAVSKNDQKRDWAVRSRTRAAGTTAGGLGSGGAFEAVL